MFLSPSSKMSSQRVSMTSPFQSADSPTSFSQRAASPTSANCILNTFCPPRFQQISFSSFTSDKTNNSLMLALLPLPSGIHSTASIHGTVTVICCDNYTPQSLNVTLVGTAVGPGHSNKFSVFHTVTVDLFSTDLPAPTQHVGQNKNTALKFQFSIPTCLPFTSSKFSVPEHSFITKVNLKYEVIANLCVNTIRDNRIAAVPHPLTAKVEVICLASPKKVDTSRLTTVESELKSEINSFNCWGRSKRVHAGSILVKATCARTFATHASATDMKMSITLRFRENTLLKNDKRMSPTIKVSEPRAERASHN